MTLAEQPTLFPVENYIVVDNWADPEDEHEYGFYWLSRWPCKACGGTPLPEPGFERHRYPIGADPCLGWLPNVQFACCGHGAEGREPYVVGTVGTLRGEDALRYFRDLGVGPP